MAVLTKAVPEQQQVIEEQRQAMQEQRQASEKQQKVFAQQQETLTALAAQVKILQSAGESSGLIRTSSMNR